MNKKWLVAIMGVLLVAVIVIQMAVSFQQRQEMVAVSDQLKASQSDLQDSLSDIQSEQEDLKSQLESAKASVSQLQTENEKLQDQLEKSQILDSFDLSQLEEMGIGSPDRIKDDLMAHPEIIPQEGVLGGTMFFTKVIVMNDHWAYGEYEDGHVMGEGIFAYEVDSENGRLTWQVVTTLMR